MANRRIQLSFLTGVLIAAGCAAPAMDYKRPARLEYEPDLPLKAEQYEEWILDGQITGHGMMVYRFKDPNTATVAIESIEDIEGTPEHDFAHKGSDASAWQGYIIAGVAFRAAMSKQELGIAYDPADYSEYIVRLAEWFNKCFEIVDIPGYVCRSTLPGYISDTHLPFMLEPGAGYSWQKGSLGGDPSWYINRPNKDHVNMAGAGMGIALALNEAEGIFTTEAKDALVAALQPIVKRLVEDDYLVLDEWDEKVRHPSFRPNELGILPNGFNRIMALQLLAAASKHGGLDMLEDEYQDKVERWGKGYAWGLHAVGIWSRLYGHWHRSLNMGWSNPQALAMATMSYLMNEDRDEYREPAIESLRAWWRFMKYEPNGIYTQIYLKYANSDSSVREAQMALLLDELKSIPPQKYGVSPETERTPRKVQPIHNRKVDANYWKADPFERAISAGTLSDIRLGGADYLLAYWMGRYFGFISDTHNGE